MAAKYRESLKNWQGAKLSKSVGPNKGMAKLQSQAAQIIPNVIQPANHFWTNMSGWTIPALSYFAIVDEELQRKRETAKRNIFNPVYIIPVGTEVYAQLKGTGVTQNFFLTRDWWVREDEIFTVSHATAKVELNDPEYSSMHFGRSALIKQE